MTKKSRKHAGNQHYQHQHQRQRRGPQGTTTNTYFALTSGERDVNGEMNTHLPERFNATQSADQDMFSAPENAPLPSQYKGNVARVREYFKKVEIPKKDGNWLAKPEVPTAAEILDDPYDNQDQGNSTAVRELRPNKVEGAYTSNEEYLSTQYDLIREDALRPLREAVAEIRASPYLDEAEYNSGSNIGLYEPVYITSIVFSPRGLATRIAFSLSRVKKFIRWQQSKRLISGTLVALSPADDCFQRKCVLATVAARPVSALDQNPPEIDLFFARPEDLELDPMRKWIMVEARSSFYEASRHTMLSLQQMVQEPFPLSEYLVGVQKNVEPPKYLLENPYTDLTSLVAINDSDSFQKVNILKQWPDSQKHGLDESQSQALHRILTNRVAIVQGPPGTGKTYVSVVALKILLANMKPGDPPIIVTCQTNHALDQLLRHIAEFETDFIRLGGRSKDQGKIKERTLYEVRMQMNLKSGGTKTRAMNAIRSLTKTMQLLLNPLEKRDSLLDHKDLLELGLITEKQADSIYMDALCAMGISADMAGVQMEQWIGKNLMPCSHPKQPDDFDGAYEEEDFEVEQLQELEAEAVARDDDDIEALNGPRTLLNDNVTGINTRSDAEIRELLDTDDLYSIPAKDRGAVYNYFLRQAKRLIRTKFRHFAKEYYKLVHERKIGQWEQDLAILSSQRLVGMTTTGLSKYRGLISALQPKIVVVEEAAETLEAPVTAACLPSLEHLILVGDHQQLRPHCQVRDFEDEPFNLNLSLFERLVVNGIEMDCLTKQRRMIPEIRRLLEPIYGTTLEDHPSVADVSNRPPVEGMGGCNSFFFTHEWLESCDANKSAINEREASMVAGFFDYLVLNGIHPSKITVLTFYNGQRKMLNKKLALHPNLRGSPLKIVTVDSYQGEENDIVLLSLVRSNNKQKIGFLNVDNRVCVALSRARRGFYIFGNGEMMACESATWGDVVKIMYGEGKKPKVHTKKRRNVGYYLPLQCTNHGRKTFMQTPDDWELINGGCDAICGCQLPCGHKCTLKCHPFDKKDINCTQKCQRRLEICGHQCSGMCCDPCKCQICHNRLDGSRALLKPTAPLNGARRYNASSRPNAYPRQASYAPPQTSKNSDSSDCGDWHAYVNGGAQADDAEFLRRAQREEAQYVENMSQKLSQEKENSNPAMSFSTSPFKASSPAKASSTASRPATPKTRPMDPGSVPSPPKRLVELSPIKPTKAGHAGGPSKPLIEFSPNKKPACSGNADLLIDLGVEDVALPPQAPQFQPARTKNKKKGNAASSARAMNLLD